jgi:hypothetical protein
MDPITATWITGMAINFASDIIVSGFKSFQDKGVDHDLELAYDSALKKWSCNSQLRHQKEHLSQQKLNELQEYLNGEKTDVDDNTLQFIRIFENEICEKKYQSLYQHVNLELQKKQIDLLQEIRNNQNHPIGPVPELKLFSKPLNYINRTVSGYSNSDKLIEIIKNEHAVALLGEGGLGKTTELDNVASILSKVGWYCGLIRLIDYPDSLEKLIESQFEHWQNIPESSKILVLLDGLDEVSSSNISKVENEIVALIRLKKNVHFLISYRNSYSLFLSLTNEKEESKEMVRVNLDPISEEFIVEYIQDYAQKPTNVIEQFRSLELFEICKNPFYLVNYIEIINQTGNVPDNKSDFFEKILKIRIGKERGKGNSITQNVRLNSGKVLNELEKLALVMQVAGKYKVEDEDIHDLISNDELFETSKRIVLYESDLFGFWRFEHNNFQEYLAAKKLSKCSWEQVEQILFLPNKNLRPKWYNAISFLINQLDQNSEQHQQLVEWLIENDRVAFVKLEVVHLDQAIRNQVFYSIYNYYKEKEIVFYAEFSAQDIAKFCDLENNQELIDFLLSELKPEMNIQNLYNVVELFEAIKPNDQKDIDRIAKALSCYLKNEDYNKYNINASILETYIKWEWQNEDIFNEILNDDVLIKDGSTRSNLLHYLQKNQPSLLTASLILRCLKIRQNDSVHTFDIYSIKEAISALSELEITALLEELALRTEYDQSEKQNRDLISVVKAIEERASILYPIHDEILSAVNKFVLATLEHIYRAEPAWVMIPFYEKHNLNFTLFKEAFLLEKQQTDAKPIYYRFKFSGFLADSECIDWVIDENRKENISDDDITKFRISMNRYHNGNGYLLLTQKMNEISNGIFFPNVSDVYTETYNKTEELYAQVILNSALFVSYIERVFSFYSKDEITWVEYCDSEDEEEHIGDVEFHINRRCLRYFMDNDKNTTKQEVLTFINTNKDWKGFQLTEHYKLSQSGKLQKENIEWIIDWCKEHELEIDFKKAITDNENGGFTYTYWAVYYMQFCLDTGYHSTSKQVLLDLVSCLSGIVVGTSIDERLNKNLTLYEYLLKHLATTEINDQIVVNLENGNISSIVLDEYLRIIKIENLYNAAEFLPKYILNTKQKKLTRYNILSTYFHLNRDVSSVKDLLDELNFMSEHDADWYIIDEFIKQDKLVSTQKLKEFIEVKQIDRSKLAIRLIKCGQTMGLDLFISILKEKNDNDDYKELRNGEFESYVISGDFNGKDIVSRITDIILVHLQPSFKNDEWSNLIGQSFNLLAHYLSSDSKNLIQETLEKIDGALTKTFLETGNSPQYQIVYRQFQKLRLDLNVQMDSECEIDEAVRRLNSILGV